MSLTDLASIGSFVSGLAVLVSLVFLYVQLRQVAAQLKQSQTSQQALVQQGRIARSSDQLFRLASPDLTGAWLKGMAGSDSISEEEYVRFFLILTAVLRSAEDVFFQHEIGLLDDASLENQLGSVQANFAARGGRALWNTARQGYHPAFVARIDQILAGAPPRMGPLEAFAAWKAQLAKSPT